MKSSFFPGSRLLLAVAVLGCALAGRQGATAAVGDLQPRATFAGTSPADAVAKGMLGLPEDVPCDVIKWHLVLHRDASGAPVTYELVCEYGVLLQGTLELGDGAKRLTRRGPWRVLRGSGTDADAVVYQLGADGAESLAFQRVGSRLLHLQTREGLPMAGNAGWSYTLNQAPDEAEGRGDQQLPPAVAASPFAETDEPPRSAAPAVVAFVGRTPGLDLDHPKVKWELTLQRDPGTLAPTTFRITGTLHRASPLEGRWRITRGATADPDAEIYELDAGSTKLLLFKLDENVLMFLDNDRNLRVGSADFSFTLNRAKVRD